ncbi:ABC transporter ATP-binding protein [Campylobacter ureolyticus]|uniref:Iron ABC transporter, ATP-binding protein n=1 Tax=Campylobacter ureolyticus TaxID=827 RepID=A0AAE7E9L3_9BACT|nr:ABC transporter ATP-binding protein [Campylobacter ureolyticus]MCR8685470.1 ABC transporter ATP-binding protein [Campylobacter ureolyticus]QKF84196.1 iron ABC transporter, ATP-binding protein [Campylobacter ureolyticus]QQY35641.1 ABC transporter ATP-binding protein [Campylobacter ureolyticus]SUX23764.1 spermidine/putrescine transport system ATP-binding protein [Campylobacter ureolyticus]
MFLELKNISFSYKKDQNLISNLNFSLQKGKRLAILGESGSGKSTILRLISGFENLDSGEIWLNGQNITFLPPNKRNIGYLFQDYALFPHLKVWQNIGFGIKNDKKRVDEMLELIRMSEYRDLYPHALSGGQQQRVALARALAIKPKLLLLDEPFSALDADLRTKIRTDIKEILDSLEITSILVTHDLDDVKNFSDESFILK